MSEINNRYDFLLFFDVCDGNPNGDPDAGNLPRIDAETGNGLVTDVCLKRKVRNYVQLTQSQQGYDIYIKEKAVLGHAHLRAFNDLQIKVGEESQKKIPSDLIALFEDLDLFEGLSISEQDEAEKVFVVAADADKNEIKSWLKEAKLPKKLNNFISNALKDAKSRKPTAAETEKGRDWMCKNYYDVRTFGAVMSLRSAPNCGQVRGPVQLTFARSVVPVAQLEYSITRMAVATDAEAEKQSGDNRTMGRKFTIPYGLYVGRGFVSPQLAAQTGFSQQDLDLFFKALGEMFEHDRSAARGMMATRKLIVFKHADPLGNAPAWKLFDLVKAEPKDPAKPPREFGDFTISIDRAKCPAGVEIIELV